MRFSGKSVLITGGGAGIGRTAALAFAREGARVMIADLDPFLAREALAELQDVTEDCSWVRVDVRHEDQIQRMVEKTVRRFGRIDALINNAALGATVDPIEKIAAADWDAAFAANIRQMFLCAKHVVPVMIDQGGGAVVNTATVQAILGQTSSLVYGPAKAGIINLTRHLALYHGPQKVRVNCLCPGHILTSRTKDFYDQDPGLVCHYPIGRLGAPEDVAHAYMFLSSDEAAFLTGAVVVLDGGYTTH